MKKRSPKSESMQKTKQDSPMRKILTFGQRSIQKSKSTRTGQSQQIHGPGWFRVSRSGSRPLTSYYDVLLTWTRVDMDMLAWLITSSDDVRMTLAVGCRHVRVVH